MTRREFQLVDGSSNKFWAIELDGDRYTVQYGRIGTTGQSKEKSFDSEQAAEAAHDKMIAAKVKGGYSEIGGTGPAAQNPTPTNSKAQAPKKASPKKKRASAKAAREDEAKIELGELKREIRIDPVQRLIVTWEEHETLKRPDPPAFDLADAQKRLASVKKSSWSFNWSKARIPDFPAPIEAQFWLLAHQLSRGTKKEPGEVAEELGKLNLNGKMELKEIRKAFKDEWMGPDNLLGCVAALLDNEGMTEFMLKLGRNDYRDREHFQDYFRYVLPFLSKDECEQIQAKIRPTISPGLPANMYEPFPMQHYLGSMFGCHQEIAAVLANIPDDHYIDAEWDPTHYQNPQFLVFGLPDRASVIAEFARLRLKLRTVEEIAAWLALTEFEALGVMADSICAVGAKADAAKLAKAIHLVVAPEMATPALQLATASKAPQIGLEWLTQNPLEAAVGLAPAAMKSGKMAQAARDHLHLIRRSGRSDVLEAAMPHLEPKVAEWLRSEILETEEAMLEEISPDKLPNDLRQEFEAIKPAKASTWLDPTVLPPIKIGSEKLGLAEITTLVSALKTTPVTEISPLMTALKKHGEPTSLDNFAWRLFEMWLAMGAVSKEKWAMGTLGHLGGDHCVLHLTPLVRQWPGESQHQRAVFGLDCLRAVNSETALMALNGIALKLKFKALKEKAKVAMEEIAKSRGMTRDELADRIVPDCGLDEKGTRVFDFGPRQFTFVLAGESKPMVRDAAGKVRANLPKPNKSDDPDKSEVALAEWKNLKKTLRETLKVQGERFENAMITGRRWTTENFDAFIIKHPFMINLARQLVFAAYDKKGKMTQTFRVTEDQTIADQNDDEATLPTSGTIGVVHPAHLDDPTKSAWGEVLADYGIIPPFQQLGRTICTPEREDLESTEITRFKGSKIPGITMYGMLERSHWLRDTPADGGGFMQHSKYFEASDLTAFIAYEPGLSIGWYDEEQELASIYFVKGHVEPDWWGDHKNRLKIGDIDAVVISEVLRLAHAIMAKAE